MAETLAVYAAFLVPKARVVVLKVMAGAAVTAMLSCCVAVSAVALPESVTLKVTFAVPTPEAVGVPVIAPAEDRLKPAGSVPLLTAYVYGEIPPLAASDAE